MSVLETKILSIKRELENLEALKKQLLDELHFLEHQTAKSSTSSLSQAQKISLFRELFFGRQDVYARRFESSKTNLKGYLPVCMNEWKDGLCQKPNIKCSKCENKKYAPFSDEVIKQHLQGRDYRGKDFTAGIYPLQLDETCHFLAIDFDKKTFKEDASAVYQTCKKYNIPAYIELSRSGNGIHIWIFFNEAIYASTARKLGCFLLTETLKNNKNLSFASYDRLFPNQDTLPIGGLGNLIALPLQAKPRMQGCSVFVDDNFIVFPDQWDFLLSIKKISKQEILDLVVAAAKSDQILPVAEVYNETFSLTSKISENIKQDIPLDIKLDDSIYLYRKQLSAKLRTAVLSIASFANPEFYAAQAMRMSTYNKPRIICCFDETEDVIKLPRGCLENLINILHNNNISYQIADMRTSGNSTNFVFRGQLYPEQKNALNALLKYDNGILSASTAFGKTVVAINLMALRKVNILILVHRTHLIEQWKDKILSFTNLTPDQIGEIHGIRKNITNVVDIASIQSLIHQHTVNPIIQNYGMIVVDECHHLSAFSFESVIKTAHPKYVLGLSATLTRKDGHQPIVMMQCGPVRYNVQIKETPQYKNLSRKVLVRKTSTCLPDFYDQNTNISNIYDVLMQDEIRNNQIISDVKRALSEGRTPVIVTERKKHLEYLAEQFSSHPNVFVMKGGMRRKTLQKIRDDFLNIPENQTRLLITTGKFLGEGFDDPRLDTLFLVMPISWRGVLAQYVGRLNRLYERKKEVIVYDYVDMNINTTFKMFQKRLSGYKNLDFKISDDVQMTLDL